MRVPCPKRGPYGCVGALVPVLVAGLCRYEGDWRTIALNGWAVLAIVPAFGIDTFAVAIGLGAAGIADRRRLALVVALFEGGMPIVGALIGTWLGALVSGYAVWIAALILAAVGVHELVEGVKELREEEDDDAEAAHRSGAVATEKKLVGVGLIAAGLSVSMDELAAGLAAGAAQMPLAVLAPVLALQAAVFTYAGMHAGNRLRSWAGRYGELVAGAALLLASVVIVLIGSH